MDGPASSEHLVEITATNVPRFALAAVSTDVVSLWAASNRGAARRYRQGASEIIEPCGAKRRQLHAGVNWPLVDDRKMPYFAYRISTKSPGFQVPSKLAACGP